MYTRNLKRKIVPNTVPSQIELSGDCIFTGQPYSVVVPMQELWAYEHGELAQNAFKSLTPEQREFLISGISPNGWNETFPPGGES